MSRKFILILGIPIVFILGACTQAPSEGDIQTAIAATAAGIFDGPSDTAVPTSIPERTLTPTPEPTATVTVTPTETPTETSTSTPDLRVIAIDSREFLLEKEDLPLDAKYYLPNSSWISPHHNSEIISGWGQEAGLEYLELTGRIDGWWVYYKRGTDIVRAPEEIFHNIIQYESVEGAQLTVTQFDRIQTGRDTDFEYVDVVLDLGDVSIVMIEKTIQPNGNTKVHLEIDMAYRNYVSVIDGWGWEDEVELEYLISIQLTVLEKLMAAPLVESLR